MLDEYLKTFICVAESGSFLSASEQLFLSPNAVKKRIDYLEENTGLTLFFRSQRGISLTKQGEAFLNDSKIIVENIKYAIERAKEIQVSEKETVRVGMMDTFADEFMMARWFQIRDELREKKISVSFFGLSNENMMSMLKSIGKEIDVVVDIYDAALAEKLAIGATKLSDIKLFLGIPSRHRLCQKANIEPHDLAGEKIMILKKGRFPLWDDMLNEISKDFPGAEIEEIDDYSIKSLNRCETEDKIMVLTESTMVIYPFYKYVPLPEKYTVPFGVYHSLKTKPYVEAFLDAIKAPDSSE